MEADILMQLLFLYFMYQILCVMLTIRKSQRERMVNMFADGLRKEKNKKRKGCNTRMIKTVINNK